jgi:hypothetical protein
MLPLIFIFGTLTLAAIAKAWQLHRSANRIGGSPRRSILPTAGAKPGRARETGRAKLPLCPDIRRLFLKTQIR